MHRRACHGHSIPASNLVSCARQHARRHPIHRNRRSFARLAATLPFAAGALSVARPGQLLAQTPAASASPQLPATVTNVHGEDVTVDDISQIIPLNGNVTETLFALGLGANVV